MITNAASGTNIHEIAPGIYRINTPVDISGGPGFNFNQYLIADVEPLVFHTGPRRMYPLVAEAIGKVLPLETIRYVAFSHVEADECGALNDFLAAAPGAVPVCGQVAAMVSVNDLADRPARALADGEVLKTGKHALRWLDAPHVPHGWECGFMMETETRTLLCGDLFTQGAAARRRSPSPTSSGRVRRSAPRWTTTRMPRTPPQSWSAWLASSRRCWRACTAAPGGGMGRRCFAPWRRLSARGSWPPRPERGEGNAGVGLLRRSPRIILRRSTAFALSGRCGSSWSACRKVRSRQDWASSSNVPFWPASDSHRANLNGCRQSVADVHPGPRTSYQAPVRRSHRPVAHGGTRSTYPEL